MLKIKLFAAFAFLALASCAFLFSNNLTQAQSNKEKRDKILEEVADYKVWKQVQKPEKKSDEPSIIFNSTAMG